MGPLLPAQLAASPGCGYLAVELPCFVSPTCGLNPRRSTAPKASQASSPRLTPRCGQRCAKAVPPPLQQTTCGRFSPSSGTLRLLRTRCEAQLRALHAAAQLPAQRVRAQIGEALALLKMLRGGNPLPMRCVPCVCRDVVQEVGDHLQAQAASPAGKQGVDMQVTAMATPALRAPCSVTCLAAVPAGSAGSGFCSHRLCAGLLAH